MRSILRPAPNLCDVFVGIFVSGHAAPSLRTHTLTPRTRECFLLTDRLLLGCGLEPLLAETRLSVTAGNCERAGCFDSEICASAFVLVQLT